MPLGIRSENFLGKSADGNLHFSGVVGYIRIFESVVEYELLDYLYENKGSKDVVCKKCDDSCLEC